MEWATLLWQWVTQNAERLADYGTFLSALTALVVAAITSIQLRLNRKQVNAAQAQVAAAQRQIDVAQQQELLSRQALSEAKNQSDRAAKLAAYTLLDSYGPLVSILNMGSPRIAVTEEESELWGRETFKESNEAHFPERFSVQDGAPHGHWWLFFSGRLRIENHGQTQALVWLAVEHDWEGGVELERDATRKYILPAGQVRTLTWYDHKQPHQLVSNPHTEGRSYAYGHFTVYTNSIVSQNIEDRFRVEYICNPIYQVYGTGKFAYRADVPSITLQPRVRVYGDEGETGERVFDETFRV